ncbi:MAG: 5-methyltetrahydropteroyltriglutamate--homocysteine S-methyltransferase [Acidimicrobiia bacterium]|nr:5-methyltetrahydropteroyltriglutamate--homocysteine S-methyltransferase [Acidimicrobiia bacterium]
MRTDTDIGATVLGYPRFGPQRELKWAVESYWSGSIDQTELEGRAATLRADTWREMADGRLDTIPGNTFSYYDHVLDTAWMLGAVPPRFSDLGLAPLDTYFAMARGRASVPALEMTKWFDTNYHYLVPELGPDTSFTLDVTKPVGEYREAVAQGIATRPVILGPVSFLLLSKPHAGAPQGWDPLDLLEPLLDTYDHLLTELAEEGVAWVQLDEPCLVEDRSPGELEAVTACYGRLGSLEKRPKILVATYFGTPGPALPHLATAPIEGIALDLVTTEPTGVALVAHDLADKIVVAGVVDGRNVWRTDLDTALKKVVPLLGLAGSVALSSSCSLLHVPYDADAETDIDPEVRSWLAFARQKLAEIVVLQKALTDGPDSVADEVGAARSVVERRLGSSRLRNAAVRERLEGLAGSRPSRGAYRTRLSEQRSLGLPVLPTTTIGSYPQTREIRRLRSDFASRKVEREEYESVMRAEIESVIRLQEEIGLDVLVHGEPERNDMVQYFAEQLDGYVATQHGWVQSYGSRGVRPPILFGDVSRPSPMTVEWSQYAQSLTNRPVKGMLTGPVTMLAWSFVRDDQPLAETANQVALALRDETVDLEEAGLRVIQVDEPALRELLPLREVDRASYLDWAVASFRLATSGVSDSVQIHTHMCYGEFSDIIAAIEKMDVDVISLEASRSQMGVLDDLDGSDFTRSVGPGVYDVHSPRVPTVEEMTNLLVKAVGAVGSERLWVNPDCGLKTRHYDEVVPALNNLVAAAAAIRGIQS